MAENTTENREYRVAQYEGRISWKVEELWDGGVTRGPYGSKDFAINAERKFAAENGFAGNLVLKEVGENRIDHSEAFKKQEDGSWLCTRGCSIEMENKEIVFTEGQKLTKEDSHLGVNVVKWLEDNVANKTL